MSLLKPRVMTPARWAANRRNAQKSTGPAHRPRQGPIPIERPAARVLLAHLPPVLARLV